MGAMIVSSVFRPEIETISGFTFPNTVAEAAPRPRRLKKVRLCDFGRLNSRKEEVKKKLKEMTRDLKIQVQKRRRLVRKAGDLEDEILLGCRNR